MPGTADPTLMLAAGVPEWLGSALAVLVVLIGFSIIIFFHEMGHFLAAKWVGVRVDRFAVGFGPRVCGWRAGEGLTFGKVPDYTGEEIERLGYGETDYCLRALPLGGYVKMLGEEDILIDEKTGEISLTDDPRAFTSRPVGQRMLVVSAGVVFNLILAAMLLTGIFLIGREEIAPVVGIVPPSSNAFGKLLPGDEIVAIDGWRVNGFQDVVILTAIADGKPVDVRLRRGEEELAVQVDTVPLKSDVARSIMFVPSQELIVGVDGAAWNHSAELRKGDRIVAVNGRSLTGIEMLMTSFSESEGRPMTLRVQRVTDNGGTTELEFSTRPRLELQAAGELGKPITEVSDLLGFVPLTQIQSVEPGTAAEAAGMQPGDALWRWGDLSTPTYREARQAIISGGGRPVSVVVLRDGEQHTLSVTPRAEMLLFEESTPKVGIEFGVLRAPAIVSDVTPDSPAAHLNIPRGARIERLGAMAISGWDDALRVFKASAGQTIDIDYRVGEELVSDRLTVPSSIIDALRLPPSAIIEAINGEHEVEYARADGQTTRALLRSGATAVRTALSRRVGETIQVTYRETSQSETRTAEFTVREDNFDPWQMRAMYAPPSLRLEMTRRLVHADGNPLVAMRMGMTQVRDWVIHLYYFLKITFVTTTPTLSNVSGPVGIVNVAVVTAKAGPVELMHLLALLSVNLAVINFLPIPVMDGGLMLFLIIEKIKGRPLSLKTQMVSTLVGLAAIILIGVVVTFQDIARLLS